MSIERSADVSLAVMMNAWSRLSFPGLLVLAAGTVASAQSAGWLDRPMTLWNLPGAELPAPPAAAEARDALVRRCRLQPPADALELDSLRPGRAGSAAKAGSAANVTTTDTVVAKAGWMPFLHVDRRIVRDDIEIIGGMSAATASCDPAAYNLFVFVGGRFAGMLSPIVMTSRRDGAVGAVRITGADTITAEFARYVSTDPDCCPSSHVRVTYRIDRTGVGPVLAALEARQVRG